ncbi:hypothetical protein [uncultured Methanobrevibacter sp.]|uniref:hypothetical protein n=1 Tax=uncultured Methanobrevibacter sp. TaxID=253161 RepID=UPI0025F16971|nr:hypothetical protein [uncultured Methanobrevibacter sp.]
MFKNNNTAKRADLRKRTSVIDEIAYLNLDIQACMVTLTVFVVLLFSVLSIVTAQNPYLL